MSKPMIRVALSLVIALALLVGIYTSVAGARQADNQVVQARAGMGVSFGQAKTFTQDLNTYGDLEGDCHHDSVINPEDY